MKREKQNLNIEKETKQGNKNITDKDPLSEGKKNLASKKYDASTQQTQYPKKVGYHGTQDEKDLNPEE